MRACVRVSVVFKRNNADLFCTPNNTFLYRQTMSTFVFEENNCGDNDKNRVVMIRTPRGNDENI